MKRLSTRLWERHLARVLLSAAIAALPLLAAQAVSAAEPRMVKDIWPGARGSDADYLWSVGNGRVVFFAETGKGREPWVSDGTRKGTRMIKDINPGPADGFETRSLRLGNAVLFFADDGVHGSELWRTDGTSAGTRMVKDIRGGPDGSGFAQGMTVFQGALYFFADDGVHGPELWRSNGTPKGTRLVKDVRPGTGLVFHCCPRIVGTRLYLQLDDGANGVELWATDGTRSGTTLVKDVYPGPIPSNPLSPALGHNGILWFGGTTPDHGTELWRSRGTPTSTEQVIDLEPGPQGNNPIRMIGFEGALLFSARATGPKYELFRTDGTEAGTTLVSDIGDAGDGSPTDLVRHGGRVAFYADDGDDPGEHGYELWRTNGTFLGTGMVKDINPGPASSVDGANGRLRSVGGVLYLMADDGDRGIELWRSDLTDDGTSLVKDINPDAGCGCPSWFEDRGLLFMADDGDHGVELWRTDGTRRGTRLVKDINPGPDGADPRALGRTGGTIWFTADDGEHGEELWIWRP